MPRSSDEINRALEVLRDVPPRTLQRHGYHLQPADFYSPLNPLDFLDQNRDLWAELDPCAEIDWNHAVQVQTARLVALDVAELRDVSDEPADGEAIAFHWNNPFWNNADALVQYGLVRALAPRRYVEIGCGFSSLLLARALEANETPTAVTTIEPHPAAEIFAVLPESWTHHTCILQRAPLEIFDALERGDVCFYDGSHCARVGSDVNWFFFRILPRLASGVLIHLHDIFLPEPYPDDWIFARGQTWNEQFILQAFLMHNHAYEVLIANRYLWHRERDLLDTLYAGVQPSHGASLWLRKR